MQAVSHLIHRDYESIVQDFVTLDFIPPGTDLRPILPVLAKVPPGLRLSSLLCYSNSIQMAPHAQV